MARDFPGGPGAYLDVADAGASDITGTALTWGCWIWVDTVIGTAAQARRVLDKSSNSGNTSRQFMLAMEVNGSATGHFVRSEVGDAAGVDTCIGVTDVGQGAWKHILGRKNGTGAGALQAFLNGVSDQSITSNRTIQNTAHPFRFGQEAAGTVDRSVDAKIAEVGIWDVALTDAEIVSLSKGFSPAMIRPSRLKGYWPLIGRGNPEREWRNGNGATINGTVVASVHPRIFMPQGRK